MMSLKNFDDLTWQVSQKGDEQDEYVSPRMPEPSSPGAQKLDKIVSSVINGNCNQSSDFFFAHFKIILRDVEKVQK